MLYEYKCIGAPERGRKARGARSGSDRVAVTMEKIINSAAAEGWEYLRTDMLPVSEKPGFFSRAQDTYRAVIVFRRAVGRRVSEIPSPRKEPDVVAAEPQAPVAAEPAAPPAASEPAVKPEPAVAATAPEGPRLAADRDAMVRRPPRDLG